ncbi:MAG: cupredoxin domain-containing protein [Chloroflexota bacterium]|nr:cupredoxin domain-containing protein [Chloroflexota bacterium]
MRLARPLALPLIAIALVACTTSTPGWTYAPAPSATPLPSVEPSASGEPTAAASEPAASDEATQAPGGAVLEISALNIAYDKSEMSAPADTPFQITFANNDPGIPHNVAIKDGSGADVFTGDLFNGVETRTYDVPVLAAGSYTFYCTVHPNMTGTLTVQ